MGVMRDLFGRLGAPGALRPAHNFNSNAFGYAVRPLAMGCPCCGCVTDDEALLLSALPAKTDAKGRGRADGVPAGARVQTGAPHYQDLPR